MPDLEQLYKGIPEQGLGLPNRAPKPPALKKLIHAINGAYDQAGISRAERSVLCPGMSTDEGEFQITGAQTSSVDGREIHVLAVSPDSENILEGDMISRLGLVEVSFQAVDPEHLAARNIGVTRKSWENLTSFIMEKSQAGLFEPAEKRRIITPRLRLADQRLRA